MPRTAQFDRQALAGLAAKQHGVIARGQALGFGMTARVVDYRIRGGGPPDDWKQTLARHARMSAHGIIVLHLTSHRIRFKRREVAEQIRRALAAGRQLPQIRTISADQRPALAVDHRR